MQIPKTVFESPISSTRLLVMIAIIGLTYMVILKPEWRSKIQAYKGESFRHIACWYAFLGLSAGFIFANMQNTMKNTDYALGITGFWLAVWIAVVWQPWRGWN